MPLQIQPNYTSFVAQRTLSTNTRNNTDSLEKLASGLRINRAKDDASGLQISELLRSQIRSSQKALDNTQEGLNVLSIADGGYETITSNLQRIRELTVQAASDTNGPTQRTALKSEIDQLTDEINRVFETTRYNGIELFDYAGGLDPLMIQVGANGTSNDLLNIRPALGFELGFTTATLQVDTAANAQTSLNTLDTAMARLTEKRSILGGFMNRLEATANNLSISIENQSGAEARIRNTDVAKESAKQVSSALLQQASASLLTQANQVPGIARQLLAA
jgi:flagellin